MSTIRGLAFTLFLLLVCSNFSFAAELTTKREKRPITVGAAVIWKDEIYDGFSDNDKYSPVPIVFFEGEKFFFRLDTAGWKLLSTDAWEIAPILEFGDEGYDSSSSDTLAGMNDRDPWVGAGGHIIFNPNAFGAKVAATGDITDESNGGRVVGEGFYDNQVGNFSLNTNAGVMWWSEGTSDYYYGVETSEAILGRPAYSAGTTTNFFLGGSAIYQRENSPWMLLGFVRHTWFDGDIDDSPITNDDKQFTVGAGIAYTFRRK
ncbi:MAG: MipA/OmpV family protein [Gammaproteobacteria bacterium]